jgi:hypothetical protein
MAKKTLALAFFLLSACVLLAAKCVSGLQFVSGISYCAVERAESVSSESSLSVNLQVKRQEKVSITVSLGIERVHSLLNLSRFSSAGDYQGLFIKAGVAGSFLSFDSGIQLVIPEPYGGRVIPVFVSDAVLFRDAVLGENFVLRMGAGVSVALGRSFRSYALHFGVMGLWR